MTSEPVSRPVTGAEIWVICGNACAGKTTTARLLAQRLPRAAHVDGDELQRLIVSGCRWPVPADSDPVTGRLAGEAGTQYALRIRNACLLAAAFADAGITAIVTDAIIGEGFESLTEVLRGRAVNFVVLRPPAAVLRQRGIDRLPAEAAYLADRYGDGDHPEAATFAARIQAAADGQPVNEFEGIIERGLDRLPHVGLWVDPSGLDPQSVVDLLLARRAEAAWLVGPTHQYHRVVADLRQAYGPAAAAYRDSREKEAFKLDERQRFLDLLRERDAANLLEVGAGPGHDSLYFQEQGLRVLCTDLSPAMVELCRAKGLDARVADFLSLAVPPGSFDAVYALNCLLHVPTPDLPHVLAAIEEVLVPGGLCYVGTWGGTDEEGPVRDDRHPVPRFFAFRSDERMRDALASRFHVLSFRTVDVGGEHFQSFVLEKPAGIQPA